MIPHDRLLQDWHERGQRFSFPYLPFIERLLEQVRLRDERIAALEECMRQDAQWEAERPPERGGF